MKITKVEAITLHIPLSKPVWVGKRELSYRDHTLVKVHTDEGIVGWGDTYGYGASRAISQIVEENLQPFLKDQDPLDNERLWEAMFYGTQQYGRKGAVVRGISAIDIALWDIKGKIADLPLHKLLGGYRDKVPVYISGGYYRRGEGLKELQEEMEMWAERGFRGVKMRVGMVSIEEDMERIQVARRALGDDAHLMLDAEYLWEDATTAIRAIKHFEEFNPYWIEGPAPLNKIRTHAKIRESISTPIATGGQEYTRWGFFEWIREDAIDIVQADVIVVGGVTEWIKVAHIADVFDLKVSPHANWNIHSHLVAATPNALFVEYFDPSREIKVLDKVVEDPVVPIDGYISPPNKPGYGITYDEEKIKEYRVD
ncbi:MAG: mandelate racemase/muconate lactonizing enzyme family protein [Chloroflexota bacterium]|nr:mandelate racemase/muconate lactonizing enzyme family protein [Chloroflexota bacterium]